MARLILAVAAIALTTHLLAFKAGGWWLRWRALRHQMRAAETAISNQQYLAEVLAVYRQRLRQIVPIRMPRMPRLHLPHFHVRSVR